MLYVAVKTLRRSLFPIRCFCLRRVVGAVGTLCATLRALRVRGGCFCAMVKRL